MLSTVIYRPGTSKRCYLSTGHIEAVLSIDRAHRSGVIYRSTGKSPPLPLVIMAEPPVAVVDEEQPATAAEKPQRKPRGSNSFGKGVIRVPQRGGKPDRYGARAGPNQRSVGTFASPEEAAAAAAEAEAKIAAGMSPWDDKQQRTNKHKRGEVCEACHVERSFACMTA